VKALLNVPTKPGRLLLERPSSHLRLTSHATKPIGCRAADYNPITALVLPRDRSKLTMGLNGLGFVDKG
jgi:hypothetical protein